MNELDDRELMKFRGQVGERIQDARRKRFWSQAKLSQLTGLSQGQISRIEAGERSVSLYSLVKIAAALRMNLEYFV